MSDQQYCIWNYDVPIHRRSVYSKLRTATKRFCVALAWSAYLIPETCKEDIEKIVKQTNTDSNGKDLPEDDRIKSLILMFDKSETPRLDEMAHEGVSKMIDDAKELLSKRLSDAKGDREGDRKAGRAISLARKALREMVELANAFGVRNRLDTNIDALGVLINDSHDNIKETRKQKGKNSPAK